MEKSEAACKVKKGFIILAMVLVAAGLDAQQLPIYSQYVYNKYLINPAVAGSDGYTSLNLTTRQQWTGYQGAPQTYSLSLNGRILKQKYVIRENIFDKRIFKPHTEGRVGIGATIYSDINGLVRRTGFSTSYAYHIWMQGATQLSFGLAFTGYHYKIDQRQIQFEDPDEPWLNTDFRKGIFVPDFNFGVYLLNRKFAVGFSAQELMEGFIKAGSQAYKDLKIQRTYYLFGNYDFEPDNKSLTMTTRSGSEEHSEPEAPSLQMWESGETGSSSVTHLILPSIPSRCQPTGPMSLLLQPGLAIPRGNTAGSTGIKGI